MREQEKEREKTQEWKEQQEETFFLSSFTETWAKAITDPTKKNVTKEIWKSAHTNA